MQTLPVAGGAITAAKFCKFTPCTPGTPDIAGTAWKGGTAKGATGRPALLLDYLMALDKPALPA